MESIKGTVVDIFGNILDLNRTPIPVGKDQFTLRDEKEPNKSQTFLKIKELERKSLAFHFEINARKNLNNSGEVVLPDINSKTNYSRDRSRFFVDIDKEGQFKINIPASSETGNVPLTTRYENYSSFGTEDDNNPNKLFPREDNLDIFLDSFAAPKSTPSATGFDFSKESGSILLKDNLGEAAPIDRITSFHIKHGSVYHDLLQTCYVHQNNDFLNYQAGTSRVTNVDLSLITPIKNIVSDTINVSGPNSNAGGRSGSITLDGSVELNIGANTVDRQSLWLDTAGGIVANIGRDLQNKSAAISMNGDFYLQVGGFGVSGDTRFAKQNNGTIGAVLDLRVMTDGGYVHMVRCDKNGITIMTPGNLAVHSHGNMKFTSDSDIEIDAESVIIQARLVLKELGGSI
jgi:stage V sporulation protein SpoVS